MLFLVKSRFNPILSRNWLSFNDDMDIDSTPNTGELRNIQYMVLRMVMWNAKERGVIKGRDFFKDLQRQRMAGKRIGTTHDLYKILV